MPQHLWTVVALRAIVDAATNNASIVDVLEQLNLPPLPAPKDPKKRQAVPIRIAVMTLWRRSDPRLPESTNTRLALKGPSGKTLITIDSVLDMRKHLRMRAISHLNGFPVDGSGTYRFELSIQTGRRWRHVNTQYVEVFTMKTPVRVLASGKPVKVPQFH